MVYQRELAFWIAMLAALILLLWLFSDILLPFVGGLALAYLLVPLADWLERHRINRGLAALLIVSAVVLAVIVLVLLLAPILAAQAAALIAAIPSYATRLETLVSAGGPQWLQQMIGAGDADKAMTSLVASVSSYFTTVLSSLWSGGKALLSFLSLIVVMPVVTFFLISDWHKMIATIDGWVPLRYRATVDHLVTDINAAIAGFLRGQAAVCGVVGVFYAVTLSLLGLNFGLLIGIVAGVLTFMPYVGSIAGLLIAGGVAIAQFWPNYTRIALVIAVFLVGQFLEGNVLSPKLVGGKVGLHPVWLIFAMFAFGYLFGMVGLVIGVPLAAALGVLLRFGFRRYFASPLYTGGNSG